jgi:hypothetical protein
MLVSPDADPDAMATPVAPRSHSLATAATALMAIPGIGEVTAPPSRRACSTSSSPGPINSSRTSASTSACTSPDNAMASSASANTATPSCAACSTSPPWPPPPTRDPPFAERYAREQAKGLAKTAALNTVARKLAKVAWPIVTHGTSYDPKRVDSQPIDDTPLDNQP